jgi:hypothetical protein
MSAVPGNSSAPWYRERLMWLVVGVPCATVVAGFVTLFLAIRGNDPLVRDDFRREGLAIHADPQRDAAAAAAGAAARLTVDSSGGHVEVELALRHGALPDRLVILLSHATRAEYDRMLTLPGRGGRYQGELAALPPGRWYVEVTPPDRRWRLRGDFRDSVSALGLLPGVS